MWATNSAGWDFRGADLQCVVCRHAPEPGTAYTASDDPRDAIMIILVTPEVIAANEQDAFTVLKHLDMAGHAGVSGAHTRYKDLRVPAKNVLAAPGSGGKGAAIVERCFDASAALVGAMSVGIMRAAFEAALAFTKNETRAGTVPILARQSVADLLMDMKMRAEASRYLTWKACHCLENGPGQHEDRQEMALEAKIYCSDNAVQCLVEAMKAVGM